MNVQNENQEVAIDGTKHTPVVVQRKPKRRWQAGRRSKQGGFGGLLDISLAGLVAGVVSIALYLYFHDGTTDSQADNLTSQLTALIGKISNNYGGNYATVSNTTIIANGYLKNKTSMTVSGSTITIKPGNGTLTVAPGQLQVADDAGTYTLTNLPDSVCSDMVNQLNSLAGQLSVNNTVVKAVNGNLNTSLISCSTGANSIVVVAD